jgi:hypothetical protein
MNAEIFKNLCDTLDASNEEKVTLDRSVVYELLGERNFYLEQIIIEPSDAWLRILSSAMGNFPPERGWTEEYILEKTNYFFDAFMKKFPLTLEKED